VKANRIEEMERAAESYPLLADLAAEQLSKLLAIAEEQSFEEGEIIFAEGARVRASLFDRIGQHSAGGRLKR
jgi:hypothetical protein